MSQTPLPQTSEKNTRERLIASFGYAFHGIWYALRTQRNLRIHLGIALLVMILGGVFRFSLLEFAVLLLVIAGVIITEMFNTAIELCVDLASPEYHSLARFAKDVAAGAVLITAIIAVIIGLFLFGPHFLMYFHTLFPTA